jgi:hypothetical protein
VRVDVAMVATIVKRGGLLKLFLFRASGELVVKIWRDKDRKPDTIKVAADGLEKERLEGTDKRVWEKSQHVNALTVSQYRVTVAAGSRSRCSTPLPWTSWHVPANCKLESSPQKLFASFFTSVQRQQLRSFG